VRGAALGLVAATGLGYAIYLYQPMRFDLVPRPAPAYNPPVDPDSRLLFTPEARIAVVTAHPDDAEFYIGGTLARLREAGARVWLIVATHGDKAFWPWEDPDENRRVRGAETRAAAAAWGAQEVTFLRYNDGRVHPTAGLQADIGRELDRFRPTWVFTFDGEYPPRFSHGDHRAVGIACERAVKEAHAADWLLHFSTRAPNYAVPIAPEWDRKMALIRMHASQFHGRRLAFISDMLHQMAAADGRLARAPLGEGLRCERIATSRTARD
jgi:LmbE family N-acetylglucosaminyl deacetylase